MFSNVLCKAQFNMLRKVEANLQHLIESSIRWFIPLAAIEETSIVDKFDLFRDDRARWNLARMYKVTSSLRNWYKQVVYDCESRENGWTRNDVNEKSSWPYLRHYIVRCLSK